MTITIAATRDAYSTDQLTNRTCTVGDLIEALQEMADAYGEETPVCVSNDGGYTYGCLSYESVQCEGGEDW